MAKQADDTRALGGIADPVRAGLDDIIVSELLRQRPSRSPDHAAENRTLVALARAMADSPDSLLQKLVDAALALTGAGSAGISVLEGDGPDAVFRWRATAGSFAPFAQSTLPGDFSPCSVVVDRDMPLLMSEPGQFYPYIADLRPSVSEVLLVPFHRGATPVGTVWVVAHTTAKQFDAEDARLVASLANFASAAVQVVSDAEASEAEGRLLRAEVVERERVEHALRESESRLADQKEAFELAISGTPIHDVLNVLVRAGQRRFGSDARTAIFVVDPQSARLRFGAAAGLHESYTRAVDGFALSPTNPSCGSAAYTGEAVIVRDVATDPLWAPYVQLAQEHGIRACWSFPIRSTGGKVVGTFAVYHGVPGEPDPRDLERAALLSQTAALVIERHKAEDALRTGEAHFHQLADAMPQMVWVTRPDGYHEYYNRRWYEFTGVPDGSTDGEGWNGMFHPDDRERAWATWRHSLTTGEAYEIEYRLRHHTGEYRWTLGRALPIRNGRGEIERWFGTCTDIDAIKRWQQERERLLGSERSARAEAERAGRMKDEFLATLSHELRTPLAAMLLWSKMLRNGTVRGAASQAQALEAIEASAESQKQLIEDLLDISRMTSGKFALSLHEVELKELVHAAVEAVRPTAEAKGVEVELALGRRIGRVRVDPDRTRQVVWNLLNNAVKFTDAGGEVRVRLRRLADAVQIQVQDTGHGITADFLPHVFERFRQQDGSPTRTAGGLGLGLSIARQIVELHGGTIRAESDGPGRGATFTVELPRPATAATEGTPDSSDDAVAAAKSVMRSPAGLRGTRVLFIEDNAATRQAIEWLLRDAGAEVTAVGSAAAAVAAFRSGMAAYPYDVVLSDIGLPERNGYELIRDLREIEAQAGEGRRVTPAIALTAYARQEDREQALAAGFQTHVVKPVEPAELTAVVASFAGRTPR